MKIFTDCSILLAAIVCASQPQLRAAPVELIPLTNAGWRYNQNNLDGVDWTARTYDDSGWPQGPSLLAFEANTEIAPLINTVLDDPRLPVDGVNGHAYYFRTHFNWPNPTNNVTLRFNCRIDDCA